MVERIIGRLRKRLRKRRKRFFNRFVGEDVVHNKTIIEVRFPRLTYAREYIRKEHANSQRN